MSDHKIEDHHDDSHDHHENVPALAKEIVPEKSFEDYSLFSLIVVCAITLMASMGSWMMIEKPSGGGHHGGEAHESGAAETHHGSPGSSDHEHH